MYTLNKLATISTSIFLTLAVNTAFPDHGHGGKSYGKKAYIGQDEHYCHRYEIATRGGKGGLRFMHNKGNYTVLRKGSRHGKICRSGYVTVELTKKNPHTHVRFMINGSAYHFAPHEPAHRYINTWHRKYVKIYLPDHEHSYHRYNDGKQHHYNHRRHAKKKHNHYRRQHAYDHFGYSSRWPKRQPYGYYW